MGQGKHSSIPLQCNDTHDAQKSIQRYAISTGGVGYLPSSSLYYFTTTV